jgi:UDP-glucose 4-epimerase
MKKNNVRKIIFSSSCATYGSPKKIPITEAEKTKPINPYGETKLIFEKMLDAQRLHGIRSISLRYFNAAGAALDGSIGEDHRPETHLIPKVLMAAWKNKPIEVYGSDYKTKDGTCVRDYIHVLDLAKAHMLALDSLDDGVEGFYNLGSEKGYSIFEIIEEAQKATGKKIKIKKCPRREGDPPVLIASSKKIKRELGWKPGYSDIKTIMESAWKWHKTHPKGYKK